MSIYEMPGDVLQRHAYNNVWCTPNQDNQMLYTPARISPLNGLWYEFYHMWRKIEFPTALDRYHVYQIGGIHPMLLGLEAKRGKWIPIPEVMINQMLIADIYTSTGFQIPRQLVYYLYTEDNNLLMAVRNPAVPIVGWDWVADPVHFRLYSNAYFQSVRSTTKAQYINCISERPMDRTAVAAFINKVQAMPFSQGVKYYYINGRYSSAATLATIDNGDYVDCIYDSSIRTVVDFPVKSLKEYNSSLDSLRKYLLHFAGTGTIIDYHDDVDFFLWRTAENRVRGTYIHKLDARTVRMVTHRDYAMPVSTIESIITTSPFIQSGDNLYIRMHVRNSGYSRPLIHENNRIHELYKLSDTYVSRAMLGISSNVAEWRAENLEAAMYPAIMRAPQNTISRKMVQDAYGYHAISRIIGDTPVKTYKFSNQTLAKVPIGLQARCTCYEYDANGVLLGWYNHSSGDTYPCVNSTARTVEMLYGFGGKSLDIQDDVAAGNLEIASNYRYYWCNKISGAPDYKWTHATDSIVKVTDIDYKWVVNAQRYTRVLSNKNHLAYEFSYQAPDGVIVFNLVRDKAGVNVLLEHPLGELDIFLNRKLLIEGLDYVMDFPRVYITNKTHTVNGGVGPQNIMVRFKGFCDEKFQHRQLEETGFIVHDTVSYNLVFNVRDDHVVRVNIGGSLYHRDDVKFAENGVIPAPIAANNGKPYGIRNIVVPMNNYIVGEQGVVDVTYKLLAEAEVTDKHVSDYMTKYKPQPQPANLSYIPTKYAISSPFFTKIICDLRDNILWDPKFTEHYGNAFVEQLCKRYEYLLKVDPIGGENRYDDRYVVVHPHPYANHITIGIYQHKFLRFVQNIYGQGKVDIANHVLIAPFGN